MRQVRSGTGGVEEAEEREVDALEGNIVKATRVGEEIQREDVMLRGV